MAHIHNQQQLFLEIHERQQITVYIHANQQQVMVHIHERLKSKEITTAIT